MKPTCFLQLESKFLILGQEGPGRILSRGSFWGGHTSKSRLQAPGVWCACNTRWSLLAACTPGRWPIGSSAIPGGRPAGRTSGVGDTLVATSPPDSERRPTCLRGTWASWSPVWGFTAFDPRVPPDGSYFITVVQSSKEHKIRGTD